MIKWSNQQSMESYTEGIRNERKNDRKCIRKAGESLIDY